MNTKDPNEKKENAKHSIECMCSYCEQTGTGYFGQFPEDIPIHVEGTLRVTYGKNLPKQTLVIHFG